MEAEEMQEFSDKLKEAAEGGESLLRISLAISILAVLVAMVTVLGHRTHTEALLAQTRESDQWNFYQAKNIRSNQTAMMIDMLSLQPNSNAAGVEAKLKEYKEHVAKWDQDLREEKEKAEEFEAEVGRAERKAQRFDLGEALLQIAVVLCSITLFTRKKMYFYFGLFVGLMGLLFAASALLVK